MWYSVSQLCYKHGPCMAPLHSFFTLKFWERVCRKVCIWVIIIILGELSFYFSLCSFQSPYCMCIGFSHSAFHVSQFFICICITFSFTFFHLYFLCLYCVIFSDKTYNSLVLPSTESSLIFNSPTEIFFPQINLSWLLAFQHNNSMYFILHKYVLESTKSF